LEKDGGRNITGIPSMKLRNTIGVALSVMIVTYNSKSIEGTINSIKKTLKNIEYEIIIVDNSSKKNYVKKLERLAARKKTKNLKRFVLHKGKRNLGFGAGYNLAVQKARGSSLLLINPDIILQENTVEGLFDFFKKQKKVGVVSCKLLNEDDSLQYSCRRFPTPLSFISFFKKSIIRYKMENKDHDKIMKVDWLSGSFMLMEKTTFLRFSGFDERFFMYLEDADLCRRIGKKMSIVYNPHFVAYHKGAYGSRKNATLTFVHVESILKYFLKWAFKG
jgi:GT2 family glycosyltransferase